MSPQIAAPIAHPLLRDVVVDRIGSAIVAGDLRAGEALSEEALAEELGVSRSPVREALRQLENDGLVVSEARKGATVARIDATDTVNFYDCRILLQQACLRGALPHIGSEVVDALEQRLAEMDEAAAADRGHEYLALVRRFHETVEAVCPNPVLVELIRSIAWRAMRFRAVSIRADGRMAHSLEQHRALLDAIADGAEADAIRLVEDLLVASRDAILRTLEEEEGAD